MSCQLPTDCLDKIFEYLEEDKVSLRSCLLVNRLWCQVAVRILWRNIWNFSRHEYRSHHEYLTLQVYVPIPSTIFDTLIACLPNKSKDLLRTNGIGTYT